MTKTIIVCKIKVDKGVGELPYPRAFFASSFNSFLTVKYVFVTQNPALKKDAIAFVTTNASMHQTPFSNFDYNILAAFSTTPSNLFFDGSSSTLKCPLTSFAPTIQLYIMNGSNTIIPCEGYLVVEIEGEIENKMLI